MAYQYLHEALVFIQHGISLIGILIIVCGVLTAFVRYLGYFIKGNVSKDSSHINRVRLDLGRTLILGLEFIVAADLIATTTTPDYYALGLAAIIVMIRTLLSYSISKEIQSLSR